MKFLELTIHQHESTPQDPGIAVNLDKIVSFKPFKYSQGQTVTTVVLDTGDRIDVVETYKEILGMIKRSK